MCEQQGCMTEEQPTVATVSDADFERARKYIDAVRWTRAKTYEEKAPHEYTVRKWNPQLLDEYEWFVMFIREHGVKEKFWGKTYSYLYLDGHRYWTMGAPLPITIILNRCKAEQAFQ